MCYGWLLVFYKDFFQELIYDLLFFNFIHEFVTMLYLGTILEITNPPFFYVRRF